jgi:hypothetical protein
LITETANNLPLHHPGPQPAPLSRRPPHHLLPTSPTQPCTIPKHIPPQPQRHRRPLPVLITAPSAPPHHPPKRRRLGPVSMSAARPGSGTSVNADNKALAPLLCAVRG